MLVTGERRDLLPSSPPRRSFSSMRKKTNAVSGWFSADHTDSRRFWRTFVEKLNELYPDIDFGINAKTPYELVAVLNLTGDTEQVHFSRTSGGTSLGGFLLGGLAFGAPGAIVGGMSGTQKTVGTTRTVYSDKVNVRMLWSDGLLQERQVDKRENLYHEIMNMIS